MSFTSTPLYGGAMTVDLPSHFADTSLIREVPSHQEVHLSRTSYTNIVIEILEYVDKPSDAEALQYHFADLTSDTGDSTNILAQESVTFKDAQLKDKPAYGLTFVQTPTSQKGKTPEFVHIHLLLLRLKEQGTDIMVSVNVPHYAGEYEKAAEGGETELVKEGGRIREKVLETLRVVEWGLFEGEG